MAKYIEPEITHPVSLCDAAGKLNAAAKGWSRKPLHTCNLGGSHPLRKKRWNYWNIIEDKFCFSVTLANVDYLGLAFLYFIDFEKKICLERTVPLPFGAGCKMGDLVGDDVVFENKQISLSFMHTGNGLRIRAASRVKDKNIEADITLTHPPGHETLNVVIPWSDKLFQFTSKQNCLPATGTVTIGKTFYTYDPDTAFGVLDFGRGVWPYKIVWNWGSFSKRMPDGSVVGINMGDKWTTGTGANENSITVDGKLFKVSEDLAVTYNRNNFLEPWRIRTEHSNMMDLTFTPFYDKTGGINLGFLSTKTHQCFGRYSGTLNTGEREIRVENTVGWAEEHVGRW